MILSFKSATKWPPPSITTFKIFQILLGFDFGFFEYKNFKIKFIAKLACLIQCILISYLSIFNVHQYMTTAALFWYCVSIFQYINLVVIFTLIPSDTNLGQFRNDLNKIDLTLKTNEANKYENKWKLLVLPIFISHRVIASTYFICAIGFSVNQGLQCILHFMMTFTKDFVVFLNMYVFYLIYIRLYLLNHKICESDIFDMTSSRSSFMLIGEVAEKYKKYFDLAYIQTLVANVVSIMITMYNLISGAGFGRNIQGLDVGSFEFASVKRAHEVTMRLFMIFAPVYCAQKITSEVGKLRALLYDKLMSNDYEMDCNKLERFIRYVEARPLRFTVYNVIPLDASLLGMVLHFCATYLIVIIQFTHLY